MNSKLKFIYEGKAKKIFAYEDSDKVIIEFKDDATAFNALKKAKFEGKGELNCLISSKIFEFLIKNNIPTHYIGLKNTNSMIAQKIKIIPLEVVLRNTAYGSLCKQTTINCRLWDLNQKNGMIVSLDKDRFRNDLGGFIEAYSEINKRINNFI